MSAMSSFLADTAYLPEGWAHEVRLDVGPHGRLEAVEPGSAADGADLERVRGVVVPGVPNVHSHAFQRAMAGLAERGGGDDFWGWRQAMYRFALAVDPDELEAIARQLFVEMLKAGYTSVAEFHYLHRDRDGAAYDDPAETSRRLLRAARDAGIGLTLLPCLYTSGGFGGADPEPDQRRFLLSVEELLGLLERLAAEEADDPGTRIGLALHSLRAVTPGQLEEAVAGARSLDAEAPIHVHAAEQEAEVDACRDWSGARPIEWLLDHAPIDDRWCLVHATQAGGEELRGLARSGAVAGLCPTTEANLGDGVFRLGDYLARDGRFGIGSDSHVCVDPTEELRWLAYGQRLAHRRRAIVAGTDDVSSGARLLAAALDGGRAALGQPVGRLAPGARADWVVLDPEHPVLAGREGDALLDSWIVSGDRRPVRDVMVAGEWRVREGRHPDEERVSAAYREVVRGLAERV